MCRFRTMELGLNKGSKGMNGTTAFQISSGHKGCLSVFSNLLYHGPERRIKIVIHWRVIHY